MRIVYVGAKLVKNDNICGTKLSWSRGEVLDITDDKISMKLLEHPDIWRDASNKSHAEIKAMLLPLPSSTPVEAPKPRLQMQPQGGSDASPFWDPIVIPIDEQTFRDLQNKKCDIMFVEPGDVKLFNDFKKAQKLGIRTDGIAA